jgi:oligopeptide/dipeptide ABC transporter ATP-binding protein
MYLGKIVEVAEAKELFRNPVHPYTRAICDAAPIPDPTQREKATTILQGEIGSNINPPSGCRFHPRCKYATAACSLLEQRLQPIKEGSSHLVACDIMVGQKERVQA